MRRVLKNTFKSKDIIIISIFSFLSILFIIQSIYLMTGNYSLYHQHFWPTLSNKYNFYKSLVFLGDPKDIMWDLFFVLKGTVEKNPYFNFFKSSYPPLILVMAQIIAKIFNISPSIERGLDNNLGVIIFFLTIHIFLIIYLIFKIFTVKIKKQWALLIGVLAVFSYPLLFSLHKGNFIITSFIFVLLSYYLYFHKKGKISKEFAILSLAIAASIKLYPACFAIFFLYDNKKFKLDKQHLFYCFKFIFYFIILFFIPFFYFQNQFNNFKQFLDNLQGFKYYVEVEINNKKYINNTWLTNNLSLSAFLQILYTFISGSNPYFPYVDIRILDLLSYLSGILIVIVIILTILYNNKRWLVFLLCGLLSTTVLPNSFGYTLLFMMIGAIDLYLLEGVNKNNLTYYILFIIIFTPFQLGFFIPFSQLEFGRGVFYGVTYNQVLIMLSLFTIFVLSIVNLLNLKGEVYQNGQISTSNTML